MRKHYPKLVFLPNPCRLVLIAGWLLLSAFPLAAAGTNEEWLARSWQTEEGLPGNSVNGVAQTADGYLWVGTPSGLARFDGLDFEVITLTNVIALPNRGVITMVRGRRGALWLAMDRGAVVRLSGSSSRAFVKDLPNDNPYVMAEDASGNLWITYRPGSVYCIRDDHASIVQGLPQGQDKDMGTVATDLQGHLWYARGGQVGVISNGVFQVLTHLEPLQMRLAAAQDGGMWVCCGNHLYKCNHQGQLQDFGEFYPENSRTVVTDMLEDRDGNLWIGTSYSGLYCRSQSGFQLVTTSHLGILSLTEDHEGNIWAGTDGSGLSRIRRRTITLQNTETGLPYPAVESICEGKDGTTWAVTQNNVLVHQVDGRWISILPSGHWPGGATCVTCDAQGTIWVGTRDKNGLYCWRDGKFVDWAAPVALRNQTFHTLVSARNGDLWIGQESPNEVIRLRQGKITPFVVPNEDRIIRAMVEGASGDIWIGTSHGNLLHINADKINDVTPRPAQNLAPIRCLYATSDGALWIGYAGWGVGHLKNGRYNEFNLGDGLFDDSISHIVADDYGWLWFGAGKGIFKVRQKDFDDIQSGRISRVRSVHYGRGMALPSLEGTFGDSPDVLRSRDGRIWIPMKTALVVADPSKQNEGRPPPPALLTRVSVDDRTVAQYYGILPPQATSDDPVIDLTSKDAVLPLPPGYLKIEFTAFDFSAPENIQFRHRLTGILHDGWVESGPTRSASYPAMRDGKYELQVAACNEDGDWNQNPTTISLAVAPFFWDRWWFRLAAVAVFTLCVIAIVRYVSFRRLHARLRVLEQQAALQRERARIAKDIHDDLGANLTQIAYLGELANQDRDEPNLVGERIGKISATARQTVKSLDEIVWAVNPRNDTLAHLLDYAGQFTLDYLRTIGIRCRLDFPTSVPERELSTDLRHNLFLVIKEALHNIFKHAKAGEVWLRATVDESALEVIIEDNGRGFAAAPDDALADGLRNMRQRMEEIGGSFRVESQVGHGTRVFLRLPWPEPK